MKTYPLALNTVKASQKHLKPPPRQRHQQQQLQQELCKTDEDVTLAVGHAPWWIPILANAKTNNGNGNGNDYNGHNKNNFYNNISDDIKRNMTFAEALRDFLQNFSFHCYGKLVESGRRYQEKLFWFIFHVAALTILIRFLLNYNDTGERKLTTSIYDPSYPIRKVPFPAISVCSVNRISNTSAMRYAEELCDNRKDSRNRGVKYFYERIKLLRFNYYTRSEIPNYDEAIQFQRFLDAHDRDEGELFYNTRRRMMMLTPNCSNILLRCRLAGMDIDCARDFRETFTSKGLCCTFNYNRKISCPEEDVNQTSKRWHNKHKTKTQKYVFNYVEMTKYAKQREFEHRFFGQELGLILLLNASHKDDLFESSALDSFTVAIHSSTIYPDNASGSMEERFVRAGTDTFISLSPRMFQTLDEARFLRPRARNCIFRDEMPTLFGKSYTFSNCITHCRHRSIMVLCQCLLFTVPHEIIPPMNDTEYCSLQHRECLNRYNFKWFNVITQRQYEPGLEREMEDALFCPQCLPSCSEIRHSCAVMRLPLNKYNMETFHASKQNTTDVAIVRVYFGETHIKFYRSFLLNSWFEVFSHVGNICSVIAGFSLIGICEVIFFVVQQLYTSIKNEALVDNHKETGAAAVAKSKEALIILP